LEKLKSINGYSNLLDFYDLQETLGQGEFGLVKLATHKVDGYKTAVKIVKKLKMTPIEIY
jgi:serine/threonine protein kinase